MPDDTRINVALATDSRRKVYEATEYEPIPVSLSDLIVDGKLSIYPQIADGDYLRVFARKDKLVFQTGGYMGLIPLNDRVVLDIRPRVPVRNLERILLLSSHSVVPLSFFNRSYALDSQVIPSLIEILADALISGIGAVQQSGLHREYIRRESSTAFPKGKLALAATAQQHIARGRHHVVEASWFEQTKDVPVNRCLKYAIWYLSEKYRSLNPRKGWRRKIERLNQLYQLFDNVKLDYRKDFLRDTLVADPAKLPSIRSYYSTALGIAKTIIENRGVSLEKGGTDVSLPSLVFRMEDVFERYVLEVLRQRCQPYNPSLEVLDGKMPPNGAGKLLFDSEPSEKADPDVVFRINAFEGPRFPLILDAKYKVSKQPSRSDLNQIISYGCSYRSPIVALVSPAGKDTPSGLALLGKIDRMSVYDYKIDLASRTPEIEEAKFFNELRSLVPEFTELADL